MKTDKNDWMRKFFQNYLDPEQEDKIIDDFCDKFEFYSNQFEDLGIGLSTDSVEEIGLELSVELISKSDYFQNYVNQLLITEEHLNFLKKSFSDFIKEEHKSKE